MFSAHKQATTRRRKENQVERAWRRELESFFREKEKRRLVSLLKRKSVPRRPADKEWQEFKRGETENAADAKNHTGTSHNKKRTCNCAVEEEKTTEGQKRGRRKRK